MLLCKFIHWLNLQQTCSRGEDLISRLGAFLAFWSAIEYHYPGVAYLRVRIRSCKEIVLKLTIKVFGFLAILFVIPVQASDLQKCKAQNQDSFEACQRLASSGNPDGQFGLGLLLLEGNGVEQNYQKS